ncbi:MAG: potassium channel protein [Rhodocyclaceae bacterium]|nr:potassium channel protein [Rhodocyclaceae bacterium]MCP5235963.1 potassium channel protein [Zoogloeaceae bacterium]
MIQSQHRGIIFLVLRRMRAPLAVLISIFAIAVLGLTVIPGIEVDGEARRMSFFHAFYFISYTATTIGFGEVPIEFSEAQRMWVTVCIYLSVVGWAYAIGALFALMQDTAFRDAVRTERFAREVRRLAEPFYLVCGYGETGRLVTRALDHLGIRVVAVEIDPAKAAELDLHSLWADVPSVVGDAAKPQVLRLAGLEKPECRGVMALTNDDQTNLAVAITARLLAPQVPALCRTRNVEIAANMASFGTRHIINPFEKFGEYLALALHSPSAYHLLEWLTGIDGTEVEPHRDPPRGTWVLCGYGNFGRLLANALEHEQMPVVLIDRDPPPDGTPHRWVQGDGTCAPALLEAGIRDACGIVACTGSDVDNLSICVTARELKPDLFVVVRQNHFSNNPLFDAFEADARVVPSRIIAHECLAILTTPLLVPFLDEVKAAREDWSAALLARLTERFGWRVPHVWSVRVNARQAPALFALLMPAGPDVTIDALLRDHARRDCALHCEVLLIRRDDGSNCLLPKGDQAIRVGDELLLVGDRQARSHLSLTVENPNTLDYVLGGRDLPGGWVWQRLSRRHG